MIWFTSDWHLFHENILKSCKRPFKNVQEMGEKLLRNYNELVGDDDTVYFLGDLTMRGPTQVEPVRRSALQMKGRKHYVMGNHDRLKVWSYLKMGFASVHTGIVHSRFVSDGAVVDICCQHDPADKIPFPDCGFMLCGHVHNLWQARKGTVNVGVDVWDFKPVRYEMLLETLPVGADGQAEKLIY